MKIQEKMKIQEGDHVLYLGHIATIEKIYDNDRDVLVYVERGPAWIKTDRIDLWRNNRPWRATEETLCRSDWTKRWGLA